MNETATVEFPEKGSRKNVYSKKDDKKPPGRSKVPIYPKVKRQGTRFYTRNESSVL